MLEEAAESVLEEVLESVFEETTEGMLEEVPGTIVENEELDCCEVMALLLILELIADPADVAEDGFELSKSGRVVVDVLEVTDSRELVDCVIVLVGGVGSEELTDGDKELLVASSEVEDVVADLLDDEGVGWGLGLGLGLGLKEELDERQLAS